MPAYAMTSEEMVAAILPSSPQARELRKRGINVYTMSELWGVSGRGKSGEWTQGLIERPLFGLTIEERVDLFRKCSPVFGVVTARMNRIAALEWEVEKDTRVEDRIESRLKMLKSVASEYGEDKSVQPSPAQVQMADGSPPMVMPSPPPDLGAIAVRRRCYVLIRQVLPEVKPDLSNFASCLVRWRRRLRERADDRSEEIKEWLMEPNLEDDHEAFVKKSVQDAMIHGSWSWYKEPGEDKLLANFYTLPGGTTIPMRNRYVGGPVAYVQLIPALEPKVYFQDEISYRSYVPSSAMSYGMVPLEALVNKLAETLFFDQAAALRADGTEPPSKVVLFGESAPFGDLTAGGGDSLQVPMESAEQSRIEEVINKPRKYAIRVLSGYGTPAVLDLSKADTFNYQHERQKYIREEVALCFNMSNMEINLTGGEDTSGRTTAESQERIEREKGIYPVVKMLEGGFNRDIIPYRWGTDYHLKYKSGLSEQEELEMDIKKIQSKTYSVNELRMARGEEPYPDPKYDLPEGGAVAPPDGSASSPFNMNMNGQQGV